MQTGSHGLVSFISTAHNHFTFIILVVAVE
eukprot:COSAG02_NODE_888_length_16167_cov_293.783234_1_plen_29_part_10